MAKLYGREHTRGQLLRYVGDISQVAGARRCQLTEGNQAGVEAIDFRTGSGFNFTVLPGRGMDISFAEYQGATLCWRSPTGDVAAAYFEPEGLGWLRGFFGGLLATCGLTYVGMPCTDQGEELGLHGRVSYTPATHVAVDGQWEGDDYIMWAQGRVREAAVYGANLCLTRRISARMGESRLFIQDRVENLGFEETPHMLLYHINLGFPLVDAETVLVSPTKAARSRDEEAKAGLADYFRFQSPTPGFRERVYYHELAADAEGYTYAGLVNRAFLNGNGGNGLGLYIKYRQAQLPNLNQWKMCGQGTYVVGLEPANCLVEGRTKERARGTLQFLRPGEVREYQLEVGVLSSLAEIAAFEEKVKSIA